MKTGALIFDNTMKRFKNRIVWSGIDDENDSVLMCQFEVDVQL